MLVLLAGLPGSMHVPDLTMAAPDEVKWSRVKIPTEGRTGDWVLASGSSVRQPTVAIDGTLYCYANPSGTSHTLFKSTDDGYSWSYTGNVEDSVVDIATAPGDANVVYYATAANLYVSDDAGRTFTQLLQNPGGAGSNNLEITSIDVAQSGGKSIIAVGTRDTDAAEYGGVYILDENEVLPSWEDTNIGDYDVCGVAFSPNFPADRQLVAVATDETDTFWTTRITDSDWGGLIGDATIEGLVPLSAAIAFPDDYDVHTEDRALFVAIDTGSDNGDVYKVTTVWAPDESLAVALDIGSAYDLSGVDIITLAVSGNAADAKLLAGAASSAEVYISTDGGIDWKKSRKEPTGESETYVLMASDFAGQGKAYAATSGTESAFSCTIDWGVTWNQVSLIDTKISEIIDLAVSPEYRQDNPRFMLTFNGDNGEYSLWRRLNYGTSWERVLSSTMADAGSIELVGVSPQYSSSSQLVFLAGTSSGNPAIWRSTNDGQTFTRRSAPLPVDIWAIIDEDILFIGGYDGSNGLVYTPDDDGFFLSTAVEAGSQSLNSIVVSPDYEQDGTILAGNTTGQVYWSDDNGTSFEPLGDQLPLSAGVGKVTVAFDPEFSSNRTAYAVSDAEVSTGSEERIYRFIIGKSDTWEGIGAALPDNAVVNQLMVSRNGTLYAANSQPVDPAQGEGGMERSLNPTYPLGPAFETVTRSLDEGATLNGLWLSDNQLWSIDTTATRLMAYTDSLSLPVTLVLPPKQAPGIPTSNVSLDWETLAGATEYEWQLHYETSFSSVPDAFQGNTGASTVRLPALQPATRYYWRVRATEPVLSPWSAKWSFTTILGGTIAGPELLSPKAGADEVPMRPVFQWSAIAGADSYELLVSTDLSFASPLIVKMDVYAVTTNAWQSDVILEYNTTCYWKVRAISSGNYGDWSAVGAFTTEPSPESSATEELSSPEPSPSESSPSHSSPSESSPPEPVDSEQPSPEPPPETSTSGASALEPPAPEAPPLQLTIPAWAVYSVMALLLTMVLLLVIALVMVTTRRS